MTKYFIMMTVRVVCLVLMVVITPYGWHTGILAVGAAVLPYIAVVLANASDSATAIRAVDPGIAVAAAGNNVAPERTPTVVQISETPPPAAPPTPPRPETGAQQ